MMTTTITPGDQFLDLKLAPVTAYSVQGQPTLRDQFAMAALTGIIAKNSSNIATANDAYWAYQYADAMLNAREEVK